MNELDNQDLRFAIMRLPSKLEAIVKKEAWSGQIFIGGGYIRSLISGDKINDIDVFVQSKEKGEHLALLLAESKKFIKETENAFTILGTKPAIQIIHRWVFEKPEDVANSFDFTICCAVIHYTDGKWGSYCDSRFYTDLAGKSLVYRKPIRNEDAGGSTLRILKYYQKGYRIPLDSMGAVLARLVMAVDLEKITHNPQEREEQIAKVLTGLLRVVDPNVDPLHEAHLPSSQETTEEEAQ